MLMLMLMLALVALSGRDHAAAAMAAKLLRVRHGSQI
jgi:hypothetical protein